MGWDWCVGEFWEMKGKEKCHCTQTFALNIFKIRQHVNVWIYSQEDKPSISQ